MDGIAWQPIDGLRGVDQFTTQRVLVYSPVYPEGHDMRYRTMSNQFVRLCEEATHWAPLTPP